MHGLKVSWTISYHLNNEQNIVPNNAQNNGQNNPQNIVHNNAQFEIQNHPPNAQNYVTRDEFAGFKNEFAGFKESINPLVFPFCKGPHLNLDM